MKKQKIISKLYYHLRNHDLKTVNHILDTCKDNCKNTNKDIDVNLKDESNIFLINYVILANDNNLLIKFIKFNPKIDFLTLDGYSILHDPIKYHYNDIIEILLNYEKSTFVASVSLSDIVDKYSNIALYYCINYNNVKAFDLLLNTSNDNYEDINGNNSLLTVLKNYNNNTHYYVKKIIEKNEIKLNHMNNDGDSIIHVAALYCDVKIIQLLLDNNVNVNIKNNKNNYTAIMYCLYSVNINDNFKKLLTLSDIYIQNDLGNNILHLTIINKNMTCLNVLLKYINENNFDSIYNIVNIELMTPLHLIFIHNLHNQISDKINKLIQNTNLNIQNIHGDTILHLLIKNNLWKKYKNILNKKKLNIFIKNKDNIEPINLVNNDDLNEFMDIICDSYFHTIQNNKYSKEKNDINNIINNKKILSSYILNNQISIPKKNKNIIIEIKYKKTDITTFVGATVDLIFCLIYLNNKYKSSLMTTLTDNFDNTEIVHFYYTLGYKKSSQGEFLNLSIHYIDNKIYYSKAIIYICKIFAKSDKKYLLIPINIQMSNHSHANILIIDKFKNQVIRFEPNGKNAPPTFNYDEIYLDESLNIFFKKYFDFQFIKPLSYSDKIGYMMYELIEIYKSKNICDPNGFCSLWCIWFCDMYLTYDELKIEKLLKKTIKYIKNKNIFFRDIIRSYSLTITNLRDKYLYDCNLTINDWLNDNYSKNDGFKFINLIKNNIKNIIKNKQ